MKGICYIICLMFFFQSVSQPRALLMFGARRFLVLRAALCIVNGSASLTLLDANGTPPPSGENRKMLSNISKYPLGGKTASLGNHCSKYTHLFLPK